jgi:hypothetical protein
MDRDAVAKIAQQCNMCALYLLIYNIWYNLTMTR